MLQCRSGKRTGKGAVKIAVDMVNEGLVDTRTAIKMVEPQHLDQLLHPQVCISIGNLISTGYNRKHKDIELLLIIHVNNSVLYYVISTSFHAQR